ncbi:MAG: hypothetical protein ACYTX0_34740 [Nostoc sp.]
MFLNTLDFRYAGKLVRELTWGTSESEDQRANEVVITSESIRLAIAPHITLRHILHQRGN